MCDDHIVPIAQIDGSDAVLERLREVKSAGADLTPLIAGNADYVRTASGCRRAVPPGYARMRFGTTMSLVSLVSIPNWRSVPGVPNSELLAACTRIRCAAEEFMDDRDLVNLGWDEESVTNVSIHRGLPEVRVVQFNRVQEGGRERGLGGVGADYLWWWLDETSDECFGMLVQAKRLEIDSRGRWHLDISQRDGGQLRDLMSTAQTFEVPALYAVYTGGRVFRREMACKHGSTQATCIDCRRMAISIISAYQLWNSWEFAVSNGVELYNSGISLEDLVDPARSAPDLIAMELGRTLATTLGFFVQGMGIELEAFLRDPQSGPREIAKRIFKAVVRQRIGSFSAGVAERITLTSQAIFSDVPQDRGHYPRPYFEHFLRGLQTAPPGYVIDAIEGRELPAAVTSEVDGLVLISV